jgi:hypothetical protein
MFEWFREAAQEISGIDTHAAAMEQLAHKKAYEKPSCFIFSKTSKIRLFPFEGGQL